MARSSSVRRWLEELRYETEPYEPPLPSHQETVSLATHRHARASWSPETISRSQPQPPAMPSTRVESIANKVREVVKKEDGLLTEHVHEEAILRRRLPTGIVPGTVTNNTRRINAHFHSQHQGQTLLQVPEVSVTPPRPISHQHTRQNTFLHREYSQPSIQLPQKPLNVIKEGRFDRVKLTATLNKTPKHWRTGMYGLLTDRALFFADDYDTLLLMKSGGTSGQSRRDRLVDLRGGARIMRDTDHTFSTKRNVLVINTRDGSMVALVQNDDAQVSEIWYRVISEVISKHTAADPAAQAAAASATKSALSRFFKKRPPKEALVSQGIYMNEPIFGNTLERLYEASDKKRPVPAFVQRCTEILENPPHVFSIGLYRTSGNLSHIQKLRLRVDQEDAKALDDLTIASDSDVLAGALKLFFRELQVPLVPYPVYSHLSAAINTSNPDRRHTSAKEALEKLSEPHRATLGVLCKHLSSITVHERQNQMSSANLGIVWGPSFMWPEEGAGARLLHQCTDVNRVVQYLIEESAKLFQ